MIKERLARTLDYFSISLLLKTFFTPFRQISSGRVNGPLDVRFRAFIDRTISRIIGAMVRLMVIFVGVFVILFHVLIAAIVMAGWLFVPLLPLIGVVMFIIGWVPSWTL